MSALPDQARPPWPRRRAAAARWRQVPSVLASLLLIALALWAGGRTLPTAESARPVFSGQLDAETSLDFWLGRTAPIFVFEGDLHPRQCGIAWIDSARTVRLSPYVSDKCRMAVDAATVIGLHPAGLRLLWSTIAQADREDIANEAWELARQMVRPFSDVLNSPYFNARYRDELARTLQDALRRAWTSPRVQPALVETIAALDAAHTEQLVNALWPIAVEKAEAGLWSSLSNLGETLLGRRGPGAQRSLTGRILQDMLADPRSQTLLFDAFMRVSGDPRVAAFINLFGSELLLALIVDPRLPVLVDRIAMDPQLLSQRQRGGVNFDFVTQDLPRRLLRYRHPRDHNPLAAYLVRGILRGADACVVLMLTPEQATRAAAQGIGPGIALRTRSHD